MRLAVDIRTLYTHKARGLGSALMMTLEGMRRDDSDHEYTLLVDIFNYSNGTTELVESYFPSFRDILDDPRFRVVPTPEFSHIFGSYEHTFEQLRLRRSFTLPEKTLFYGYNFLGPILTKIPTAVHVPDTFVKVLPHQHSLEQKRILAWGGVCMKEASLVTTESENSKRDIERFYRVPADKIAVVHEAISDIFSTSGNGPDEALRESLSLPQRFLLGVGVIEPRKNILNAVRALKLYNDRHDTPLSLVVVGEVGRVKGKLYTEVTDEIIRLGMRRQVIILGFTNLRILRALYQTTDAFIFTSLYEGFGLPPIEAMACGAPVILSDVSALPEIAGNAAEYIDPHDPVSIAKGIERVVDNKSRKNELIQKGLSMATKYRIETRTKRLLNILENHYVSIFRQGGTPKLKKQQATAIG